MRWVIGFMAGLALSTTVSAQQLIERTTVTEKFSAPSQQDPPTIRKTVTTTYSAPVIVERRMVPVYASPVVMYVESPRRQRPTPIRDLLFGRRR